MAQERDATAASGSQTAAQTSEECFRQLADSMPQLVWTAEPDGSVDYYNRRVCDFAGISRREDGSWQWQPVLHPDDEAPTVEAWRTAVQNGGIYQCEHRVRLADGSMRWFLSRAVPVRGRDNEIVKWYGTATDIHDLKLAQAALQETDRRKDEFLATLGHELRNPLAPIRNAVEILKQPDAPDATAAQARDMIDRQVQHMARLIDDLLDIGRITTGRLRLRRQRIGLAAVVEQAADALRADIAKAGQTLDITLPALPVLLDADPVRLTQIFTNLLGNASSYCGRGAHIQVSAALADEDVVICVRDNGVGIAPEHLTSIFDMFFRAQSHFDHSQSGLGIGLSLVQGLVEMHGGTVQARSEGIGHGSELIVRLPRCTDNQQPALAPTQQPTASIESSGAKVLIADDKADVVDSLAMLLQLYGNTVQTARDGAEAVAAAERFRPDLILLDLGMPELDGYAACRRIRSLPIGEQVKIVAVTGWGQDEDRRRTAEAGFDAHLVKPIGPEEVLALLRNQGTSSQVLSSPGTPST
jgi:PAS domain S-box-containing protein